MAIVSYDGKRLVPAPLTTISKTYSTTNDGEKIGSLFNITLSGKTFSYKGSPNVSGIFYTGSKYPPDARDEPTYNSDVADNASFGKLLRKQEAIRDLFSEDGKSLEFQSFDGSPPMKCNPRIKAIEFPQDQWYNFFDYVIECEADVLYINGSANSEDDFSEYISSLDESWQIETLEAPESLDELRTYRVTHTVNAVGKRFFKEDGSVEAEAWKQARKAVTSKLGFDNQFLSLSGVVDLPDYFSAYNHVRSENIGERDGSYSVTESWLMSSGNTNETFNIVHTKSQSDGLDKVVINGTIQGLEVRSSGLDLISSKYSNASGKFSQVENYFYERAKNYSYVSDLCYMPLTKSITRDVSLGSINYVYEYDNRPSGLITNSLVENINVDNSWGVDVFAAIPVLGRQLGPVLQAISTKKETTRSMSLEVVFDRRLYLGNSGNVSVLASPHPRWTAPYSGDINYLVTSANPIGKAANNKGEIATKAYVSNQTESWNPSSLRYTYNVDWTFE